MEEKGRRRGSGHRNANEVSQAGSKPRHCSRETCATTVDRADLTLPVSTGRKVLQEEFQGVSDLLDAVVPLLGAVALVAEEDELRARLAAVEGGLHLERLADRDPGVV